MDYAVTSSGGSVLSGATPWFDTANYGGNLATALAALPAAGGIVYVSDDINVASVVTLTSNALVVVEQGKKITWTGASAGTMFTTGTTDPTQKCGVVSLGRGIIDPATADYIFDLNSPQFCEFGNFDILDGTATLTVMRMQANATNASGAESTRNAVYNNVHDIYAGTCGYLIQLSGQTDGFVTLNTFNNTYASDVRLKGYRFVQWCDNNRFSGFHRVSLNANNAIGVIQNDSATPTAETGVYANDFEHLAVDAFTGGGLTGRVGIKLNHSRFTQVDKYFQSPAAEGGALVDSNSQSHWITARSADGLAATDSLEVHQKNTDFLRQTLDFTGDDGATNKVTMRMANSATLGQIGSVTNHSFIIMTNNIERFRITSGGIVAADSLVLQVGTSSGFKIGTGSTQKLGFWNATPIVQPGAYTQTYSTADRTHANPTATALTDNSAGSANTTLEALTSGVTYATDVAAIRNNFADLAAAVNALIVDLADAKQIINSLIDDHQAMGLAT